MIKNDDPDSVSIKTNSFRHHDQNMNVQYICVCTCLTAFKDALDKLYEKKK